MPHLVVVGHMCSRSVYTMLSCLTLSPQVYVDQVTTDVVSVTRHNPVSHQSFILISHTAFSTPSEGAKTPDVKTLSVPGKVIVL